MALVTKGSCVGILYKNKANQNAVHNGKFLSPTTVNTNKLPNVVRIVHYTKVKNPHPTPTHKYLMKREVLALKPIQLQKTPDDSPSACKNSPRKAGMIESGACIAVRFIEKGVEDVKNGRFLYAIKNGTRSCYVDPKHLPDTIVYEHMNLVNGTFTSQIRKRTGIQEVRRLVILPGEK